MSESLTKQQLTEKLCSLFDTPRDSIVSIPRIIKLRDKMMGVAYLSDYQKDKES